MEDPAEASIPAVRLAGTYAAVAAIQSHLAAHQSNRMPAGSEENTAEAAATGNTYHRNRADWEEEGQAAESSSWCQHAAGDRAGDGDGR